MNRQILVVAFFAAASAALVAQEASQTSPYQGTSTPPPDETIITDTPDQPQAKPPAGHPMNAPADSTAPSTPAAIVPSQSATPNAAVRTGSDSGTCNRRQALLLQTSRRVPYSMTPMATSFIRRPWVPASFGQAP